MVNWQWKKPGPSLAGLSPYIPICLGIVCCTGPDDSRTAFISRIARLGRN